VSITRHPVTGKPYRFSITRYTAMPTGRLIDVYDELCGRRFSSSNRDGGYHERQARIYLVTDLLAIRADEGDPVAVAWLHQATELGGESAAGVSALIEEEGL